MAQFKAINPSAEVNGQTVLSVAKGLGAMEQMGLRFLADNNITDIKPDSWYSQQNWLNAFMNIAEKIGPSTLFMIGTSIPENAQFPPEINDAFKALSAIDVAYHMNHRINGKVLFDPATGTMGEGIGHYRYKKLSDNKVEIRCDNPYPCDFDRGIIEQMAKKFLPDNAEIAVEHADANCRKNGSEACTYIVSW